MTQKEAQKLISAIERLHVYRQNIVCNDHAYNNDYVLKDEVINLIDLITEDNEE